MYGFEYIRPATLTEALDVLRADVEPRLLAGGQTLLPTLKHRLSAHSTLIDLQGIDALHGIRVGSDAIVLGAMTRRANAPGALCGALVGAIAMYCLWRLLTWPATSTPSAVSPSV